MTITKQAKSVLPFKIGAVVELTGKVTKRVRREGECKLVIELGDVPGFVVFADCPGELENFTKLNIRKGSLVSIRGKFLSYGALAVCLSDCRLMPEGNLEQLGTLKKENTKTEQRRTQRKGSETSNLRKLDILKNKSSFGAKIC
jgi:hypothetical protein